jgi:pectate lyase
MIRYLFLVALSLVFQASFAQDKCQSLGWANYDGQTFVGAPTGGGNASVIQVTTFSALKSAIESSGSKVIHVMNSMGNGYLGKTGDVLNVKSDKTVIGIKPGIVVKCSWQIKNTSNVIIRNLQIQGPGNTNANQNWDAVNIENSKRVWVDHCVVMDGEDGNFDIVKGSDNVSVTWCVFTYSANGVHNLSNLIGSSDDESESHGKLNTSYINCWWKDVADRCPRTRYGMIHMVNCYYSRPKGFDSSNGTAAGLMANNRVENCHFDGITNPCKIIGTPATANCTPIGCKFTSCSGTTTGGSLGGLGVFNPPYEYKSWMVSSDNVKSQVEKLAGNTLADPLNCGNILPADCNSVTNGTAKLDNCGRCVGGNTGKSACIAVGEAETDACVFDGTVDNNNVGFNGTGFINVPNTTGSSISFNILASSAGTAILSFRYANGGTADRPAQITLNSSIQSNNLSFPVTGSFTTWKTTDLQVILLKGINTLKLASTTSDGLSNIDQIGYVSSGLSKGNCVITGIEEEDTINELICFPNPFIHEFKIKTEGKFAYTLFDLTGNKAENGSSENTVIVGSSLNVGVYFLVVENEKGRSFQKIVKN